MQSLAFSTAFCTVILFALFADFRVLCLIMSPRFMSGTDMKRTDRRCIQMNPHQPFSLFSHICINQNSVNKQCADRPFSLDAISFILTSECISWAVLHLKASLICCLVSFSLLLSCWLSVCAAPVFLWSSSPLCTLNLFIQTRLLMLAMFWKEHHVGEVGITLCVSEFKFKSSYVLQSTFDSSGLVFLPFHSRYWGVSWVKTQ